MKRAILALVLMAMPILAQTGQDPNEVTNQIVTLRYIEPSVIRNLVRTFGVDIMTDPSTKVITVSGKRSHVQAAQDAIKQLDVPAAASKDIELTVFFLIGSDNAQQTGSPVPTDLQSTVATLKGTFPFKAYTLLDALSLRARSGVSAESAGQLSAGRLTTFRVSSASVEGDGNMIRLDRLHAGLRIPTGSGDKFQYVDTGITAEIMDVKEGQKLVVGRSSLNGPDTALFLVLIAKIVQ